MNALEQVWWTVYPQVLFVPRGVHTLRAASPRGPDTLEEGPASVATSRTPTLTLADTTPRVSPYHMFCAQVRTPRSDSAQGQDPPCERLT
jgi:hypothetical protein